MNSYQLFVDKIKLNESPVYLNNKNTVVMLDNGLIIINNKINKKEFFMLFTKYSSNLYESTINLLPRSNNLNPIKLGSV